MTYETNVDKMYQFDLVAKVSIPKHYWQRQNEDGDYIIEGDGTIRTPEAFAANPPDPGRGYVVLRIPLDKITDVLNALK